MFDFNNIASSFKLLDPNFFKNTENLELFKNQLSDFQQSSNLSSSDFNYKVLDPLLDCFVFTAPVLWEHCLLLWDDKSGSKVKAFHFLEILLETEEPDEYILQQLSSEQCEAFFNVFETLPKEEQCKILVRSLEIHRIAFKSIVLGIFDRFDWDFLNEDYRKDSNNFFCTGVSLIHCVREALENEAKGGRNAEKEFLQMCVSHESAHQVLFDVLHLIVSMQSSPGMVPSDMQTNTLSEYVISFIDEEHYPDILNLYELNPSKIGWPSQMSRYNLERELKENLVEPLKPKRLTRI